MESAAKTGTYGNIDTCFMDTYINARLDVIEVQVANDVINHSVIQRLWPTMRRR